MAGKKRKKETHQKKTARFTEGAKHQAPAEEANKNPKHQNQMAERPERQGGANGDNPGRTIGDEDGGE